MTFREAYKIEKKLINGEEVTDEEYKNYKEKAEDTQNKIMNAYGEFMINVINGR